MSPRTKIMLADDHPVIRAGLATILASEPDLTLVGEATRGEEVLPLCERLQPDVLLLDLNMPGHSPARTMEEINIRCLQTRVVILSAYDDDVYIRSMISAGAVGYIIKDEAAESLVMAVRKVVDGGTWFSSVVTEKLAGWQRSELIGEGEAAFSDRDREILRMIAIGWDNARISQELSLSPQTVRNRVSRLYRRMSVSSRPEAVVWAKDRGFASL